MSDTELEELEVDQPKLFGHCTALYNYMNDHASIEVEPESGLSFTIWRGKITKAARLVGIPDGTYRRVVETLTTLGCIEQISKGLRGSQFPTTMVLHQPVTPELWASAVLLSPHSVPLTTRASGATLMARLDEIERRLGNIDIIKAFHELQQEIDDVKKDLQALKPNSEQGETQ